MHSRRDGYAAKRLLGNRKPASSKRHDWAESNASRRARAIRTGPPRPVRTGTRATRAFAHIRACRNRRRGQAPDFCIRSPVGFARAYGFNGSRSSETGGSSERRGRRIRRSVLAPSASRVLATAGDALHRRARRNRRTGRRPARGESVLGLETRKAAGARRLSGASPAAGVPWQQRRRTDRASVSRSVVS